MTSSKLAAVLTCIATSGCSAAAPDTDGTDGTGTSAGPGAGSSSSDGGGSGMLPPATSGDATSTNAVDDTTTTSAAASSGSSSASGGANTTDGGTAGTDDGGTSTGIAPDACVPGCIAPLVCEAGACVDLGPMTPMPPDASAFAWQTIQTDFALASGDTCTGRITVALGDQTTCYAATDGELLCAGKIFDLDYGPSFAPTGRFDVDQVLFRPTFNSANGNGACILEGSAVYCMGRNNNNGFYGTGDTLDVPTWTQWGAIADARRIATGTSDSLCAWTTGDDVHCSGLLFGLSPTAAGNASSSMWLTTFGALELDDPTVFRAQQGRTECQIRAGGLECLGMVIAPDAVDGGFVGGMPFEPPLPPALEEYHCWLDDTGTVGCGAPLAAGYFEAGRVLALAHHAYEEAGPAPDPAVPPGLCAVYDDASLWCIGANTTGRLGSGGYADLLVETQVQPPGSVRVDCVVD